MAILALVIAFSADTVRSSISGSDFFFSSQHYCHLLDWSRVSFLEVVNLIIDMLLWSLFMNTHSICKKKHRKHRMWCDLKSLNFLNIYPVKVIYLERFCHFFNVALSNSCMNICLNTSWIYCVWVGSFHYFHVDTGTALTSLSSHHHFIHDGNNWFKSITIKTTLLTCRK